MRRNILPPLVFLYGLVMVRPALADLGGAGYPANTGWGAMLFHSPSAPVTPAVPAAATAGLRPQSQALPQFATRPPSSTPVDGASPYRQCRQAIATAERSANIPQHLLTAISRVESGRADPEGGTSPWPWSINVEGIDHIYDTKQAAIAAVVGYQARGIRSIDVGCLQVNLMYHPDAFATLDEGFDPAGNAAYAARFLNELYAKTGSWPRATAMYHSANPELGDPYQRKVMTALADEMRRADQPQAPVSPQMASVKPASQMAALPPAGPGAIMLGNRSEAARMLPAPMGMAAGRGLDAYRSAPIAVVSIPVASASGGLALRPRMPM